MNFSISSLYCAKFRRTPRHSVAQATDVCSVVLCISEFYAFGSIDLTRAQQLLRWATDRVRAKWAEKWGLLCPFSVGELVPHLTQCRTCEAYLHNKWYPDPSSCLAAIDMGRGLPAASVNRESKGEGFCAPFRSGAGSPSHRMWPGPRPTLYQVASCSIQPFGHNTPTLQTDKTDNGPTA